MLFIISPWADSTDLACSVPDLDEQSRLEVLQHALWRETALSDLGNLSVLGEALSFAVNIGLIAVDMHCLVKPPAFYFLQ